MGREFKGLENTLEGVNIGDLVLLRTPNKDYVVGFVTRLTLRRVRLSQEPPTNESITSYAIQPFLSLGNIFRKDSAYQLKDFNQYKVMDTNFPSK